MREDLPQCILLLAHCSPEDLNTANEDREGCTALHTSCSLGNIVITQLLIWVSPSLESCLSKKDVRSI